MIHRTYLITAWAILSVPAVAALAQEAPSALESRVRRLEDLLLRQEEKIESLEAQVQIAEEETLNQARATEIKQLIREVLEDTDFRSQLVATTLQAGYDRGFFIRSSDENFLLRFQLQSQFRYIGLNRQTDNPNVAGRQKRDDLSGFEWERIRLLFVGHLFSPKLVYYYRTEGDTDGGNAVRTLDLWFDYQYVPHHKIRWGLTKAPQGQQFLDDDAIQQMVDRSITETVFNLGRSVGVMAHGWFRLTQAAKLSYQVGVFNGFNNHNDDVRDVDTNMAVAARAVLGLGSDYGKGASDLANHRTPAMQIGAHFAFNDDNNDTAGPRLLYDVPDIIRAGRGGIGNTDATGTQYYQFGLDMGLKYRGFSLTGEWFVRTVDSESSRSFYELATLRRNSNHQEGGFLQAGYFVLPKLEAVGRLEGIWDNGEDNLWAYGLGANYYIKGHALKLMADVTWASESPVTNSGLNVGINDDFVLYRVQIQAVMR